MSKEYCIKFDHNKCTQCHGCEVACKTWREIALGIQYRRAVNIWQGQQYSDVKQMSVSISCLHCTEPECMMACPEEAIEKRAQDGVVVVDNEKCTGCQLCFDACPFEVPQYGDDGTMEKCDLCLNQGMSDKQLPCVATCPNNALSLVKMSPREKYQYELYFKQLLT